MSAQERHLRDAVLVCLPLLLRRVCDVRLSVTVTPGDIVLPPSLQCGGLQKLMLQAVLWFSSGGTRSVLHYDAMDNLNCVLDGYKQLFLVDVVGICAYVCM